MYQKFVKIVIRDMKTGAERTERRTFYDISLSSLHLDIRDLSERYEQAPDRLVVSIHIELVSGL